MQLHLINFITVKNKMGSGVALVSPWCHKTLKGRGRAIYLWGQYTQTAAHMHTIKGKYTQKDWQC